MAEAEEKEYCSNCKRDIAKNNFVMHEVHCRRNIVLCDKCHEPVPRSETEEHFDEYHAPAECSQCSEYVEISALETHKVGECHKRQMHCEYCELQLPFCDMKNHTLYCGTRTEQCPSCSTFVMIKNQDSHQGEECLAIQASAASDARNDLRSSGATDSTPHREHDPDHNNRFAMDELSRILSMSRSTDHNDMVGTSSLSAGSGRSRPSANTRTLSTGAFYGSGASRSQKVKPKRNTHSTSSENESTSRSWRLNQTSNISTHRRVAPKTAINNIQRSKRTNEVRVNPVLRPTGGSQNEFSRENQTEDLDRLLAMHLAEDLNGGVYTDYLQNVGSESYGSGTANLGTDDMINDDLELPCEFCGNSLTVSQLYDHQNGCDLNPLNSNLNHNLVPRENTYQPFVSSSTALNNRTSRNHSNVTHGTSSFVDNLAYLTATDMLNNDPGRTEFNTDVNSAMLPCEFCDHLFPEDVIIQHQAVCDANLTQTPRQMSPSLTQGSRRRHIRRQSPGSYDAGSVGASRRRQEDPFLGLGLPSARDDSTFGRPTGVSANSKGLPANRISKRNRNDDSPGESYFARALAEDSNHLDNYGVECGGSRTERRRRSSAARTRETLDQFIQDPMSANRSSAIGLSKEQKSRRNQSTRQIDDGLSISVHPDRSRTIKGNLNTKGGTSARGGTQRSLPRTTLGSDLDTNGAARRLPKPRKPHTRNKERSSPQN